MGQVSKMSGKNYRVNLDIRSYEDLKRITICFKNNDAPLSISVIVRRALRFYWQSINTIDEKSRLKHELLEVLKAAKGF